MLQSARSGIQGFAAINEELEGVVGRVSALSRSDNELHLKLEETKQLFLKELDDFRTVVLRSTGDPGADREDKKLLLQMSLGNQRSLEVIIN